MGNGALAKFFDIREKESDPNSLELSRISRIAYRASEFSRRERSPVKIELGHDDWMIKNSCLGDRLVAFAYCIH